MGLVWAQYALDDRDNIFSYTETENPRAAVHVDEEIVRAARRRLNFPESGLAGLPEHVLGILRTPNIAAYAVMTDWIRVIRVLHDAQTWPVEIEGE
ncbi:type II toxin-antitoxin system RelE/ParE family toxin [Pararhizobium sp. A13]|uniref:type II toxin-antitoxin system RelE/ParE family toxin n=1 Tax=Pararhizobium sp. A13 TaxID=3133975 RepID=UPI00311B41FC